MRPNCRKAHLMCGRYYVAENGPDVISAEYIAEVQKRANIMKVPIVTSGEVPSLNIFNLTYLM